MTKSYVKNYKLKTDEQYRTTLINFVRNKLVMFAMVKFIEMELTE